MTPGPDTALTIRNALFGGRRGGTFTAAGVATGQTTWALCSAVGIAALLRASQPALVTLRILGVCYLAFLGVQALVGALQAPDSAHTGRYERQVRARSAYRQGLVSNLSNPKMAIFFISLLPQFSARASFTTLLLLGLLFSSMTLVWLTAYAVVVARVGDFLRRPGIRRILDATTGIALIALGLRLATAD